MTTRLLLAPTTVVTGDRIFNTTTRGIFAGSAMSWAANNDAGAGSARDLIFEGYLQVSTKATSPGNLILDLSWGGAQMAVATFTGLPGGLVNAPMKVEGALRIGVSNGPPNGNGLIIAAGMAILDNAGTPLIAHMTNSAAALGTAGQKSVNTRAAATIGLAAQWSLADAGNIALLALGRWSELTS